MQEPTAYQFTRGKQFAYAIGDFGYNFSWTLVSSFLMYFWTDSFGISAGFAGTVMLLSRIWDAINDPIVGRWADRTKSKHGKYRPWILWVSVPLFIINVLCFTSVPIQSQTGRNIWALAVFFIAVLISTMFYVPYTAMLSSLTMDSDARTRCTSFRLMVAYVAAIIITRYTTKLVGYFGQGDSGRGYFITAIVYSTIGIICWLICFLNTKEVVEVKADAGSENQSLRQSFALLSRNKYVWILAFAFVSYGLFNYGRNATAIYYFTYVAGDAGMFGNYGLIHYFMSFIGAMIMPKLASKSQNKGSVPRFSYLICGILLICQFFINPSTTGGMSILLGTQAVASLCAGMSASMLYGMIPDVVDYTQYIHGKRASGFITAVVNFMLKMGMAVGVALVGWLLGATNYVPNAVQSASTITGLKTLFAILPGAFALLAFIFLSFYKLDKKSHADMIASMDIQTS